jgi:hypothetical protein
MIKHVDFTLEVVALVYLSFAFSSDNSIEASDLLRKTAFKHWQVTGETDRQSGGLTLRIGMPVIHSPQKA